MLGVPVLVPERPITSLGSAIFAFMAARAFPTIEEAQRALCPPYRTVAPDAAEHERYAPLFEMYRSLYFALGDRQSALVPLGDVLPRLRAIAAQARNGSYP